MPQMTEASSDPRLRRNDDGDASDVVTDLIPLVRE